MSNTCPIDPTNAIYKLKLENESVNALIYDISNSEILKTCPIIPDISNNEILNTSPIIPNMGGGKRRKSKSRSSSKKNKKHMKGGASLTASQVTTAAQTFLLLVLGYMSMSSNVAMNGIIEGIVAVYSGQCGTMNNKLWGLFGLGNPVCAGWNRLMTIVGNAFLGDHTSIATLSGIAGITLAIPYATLGMINIGTYYIATKIPKQLLPDRELEILRQNALGGVKEIETASERLNPEQQSKLSGKLSDILSNVGFSSKSAITSGNEEMSEMDMQEGGKRKSHASRKHKTRKSKHSRKGKKSGKSRKTKKSRKSRKH